MRLAQPALRQMVHVHNAQPWMRRRKLVQDSTRGVLRTVIDGDHLDVRIIHFHERRERCWQLFFLVSSAE